MIFISLPVAVQLYSIRDDVSADFENALKSVKDMGYDGVEFAGLCGKTPAEIKAMCDKYNLTPISAHVGFGDLMKDAECVVSTYAEIGCKQIIIPALPLKLLPGGECFDEFVAGVEMISGLCYQYGIRLGFHNHDTEFQKIDGKAMLDIMFEVIPEGVMDMQPDTCWVHAGGEDPAKYIEKYNGRVKTIHLQDYSGTRGAEDFRIRPVGYGKLDINGILESANQNNVEWIIIEQDNPDEGRTAMECIKMCIDRLKELTK